MWHHNVKRYLELNLYTIKIKNITTLSSIELVPSGTSKSILVVDGCEYYKKRENKWTTTWNCAHYQTLSFRTTAIKRGEQLISIRGNHNYDICLGKVGAIKSLVRSMNKVKFQPTWFQLRQHSWKLRINMQFNWHCPPKSVSSKCLKGWSKKRFRSSAQNLQAKTSKCLKNFILFSCTTMEKKTIRG